MGALLGKSKDAEVDRLFGDGIANFRSPSAQLQSYPCLSKPKFTPFAFSRFPAVDSDSQWKARSCFITRSWES